jgi:hypothetical protein
MQDFITNPRQIEDRLNKIQELITDADLDSAEQLCSSLLKKLQGLLVPISNPSKPNSRSHLPRIYGADSLGGYGCVYATALWCTNALRCLHAKRPTEALHAMENASKAWRNKQSLKVLLSS